MNSLTARNTLVIHSIVGVRAIHEIAHYDIAIRFCQGMKLAKQIFCILIDANIPKMPG